ncbi:unnamed protein product, partial [Candidula unifasciata]
FRASDPGTHFWHSHSSLQRSDGFFGGLVIRLPPELDPHRHLYDYDLSEHSILLIDWGERTSAETFAFDFHGGSASSPTTVLVNGLGTSEKGPDMPFPVFKVKAGKRYRFRFAYNGISNCPLHVSVDGHSLMMIATDGRNFEPVEVDAFFIFSGERYDFVLKTKQGVKDNFWIRFKGHGRCTGYLIQAAILSYEGTSDRKPEGKVTYSNTVETDSQRVSASKLPDERFNPPVQNLSTEKPRTVRPNNHQLNYISSYLPPSPPLSQLEDIPQVFRFMLQFPSLGAFCNNKTVAEDCSQVLCQCVHLLNFDLGDIVEFVLVSFTNTVVHPMHMHGHSFRVVAMRSFYHDLTVESVKSMDRKGKIHRRTSKAPYKDTLAVHAQAVTIIRFRANNPGFWFFHCHIEFHAELGMAMILQEGQGREIPRPPKGFPTCGSWTPHHVKTVLVKEQQGAADAETSTGSYGTILGVLIGVIGSAVIIIVVLFLVFRGRCGDKQSVLFSPIKGGNSIRYNSLS